jgi:cellulase/cellobiase CelA1
MSEDPAIPEPSYLPPNPSVGELVTEIDRARHEAAHTVTALVAKLDVQARMKSGANDRIAALGWDGRRIAADVRALGTKVANATPAPVASAMGTAVDYARRIPLPARVLLAVLLLRWFSARRKR